MDHVAIMMLALPRTVLVVPFAKKARWRGGYYEWRTPDSEVIRIGTSMSKSTISRIMSFGRSITRGLNPEDPNPPTPPEEAQRWLELLVQVGHLDAYACRPEIVEVPNFGPVRPTLSIEVQRIREERTRQNRRYPLLNRGWR